MSVRIKWSQGGPLKHCSAPMPIHEARATMRRLEAICPLWEAVIVDAETLLPVTDQRTVEVGR